MATTQKKMLAWQIVGAIAGIVAVVWVIITFFGGASGSPTTTNTQAAAGTINGSQNVQNIINNFQNALPPNADDAQVRTTAEKFTSTAPGPKPPYPYVVVDTEDQGLIVRTSGDTSGRQIGTLRNRSVAWVDCQADTGFNPDPTTSGGSVWLKVRWPSTTEGSTFLKSQPSDPAQGWIYTGYVVPAGHNGKIPAC